MRNKVALVTTDPEFLGDEERDIVSLTAALRDAAFDVETPIWYDQTVDWESFDVLVMRSPWDYPNRYQEFMTWLDGVSGKVRILNAPDLIRWNTDKRYLEDFSALGVPCVPYEFCESLEAVREAIARCGSDTFIMKPSVSVGSANTGWFAVGDDNAIKLAEHILQLGKTVMVQPTIDYVTAHGENALIYFNGEFAASFHKGPILEFGGGFIGGEYTENITPGRPGEAEIAVGSQAMQAIGEIARRKGMSGDAQLPLYARVDVALVNGVEPQIIEVEAFEPAYFADVIPEVVPPFVRALSERLSS